MEEKKNSAIEKTENIADNVNQEKVREDIAEERRRNKILLEKRRLQMLEERNRQKHEVKMEKTRNKQQRERLKSERKKDSRAKGFGGWLAAVISLGACVLILGGLLTFTMFSKVDEYMMTTTGTEQSFYDLVGYVDNLDVNLSKLTITKDDEQRQKLLGEVRVEANLAVERLSEIPLQDEDRFLTTKFINQVGDFSKYLNEKLIEGETFSKSDIQTLEDMQKINASLKQSLIELSLEIENGYNFKSLFEGKEGDIVIAKFKQLESNATNYPHMIYDGAFSDGTEGDSAKALEGLEEVSKMKSQEIVKGYFAEYNINNFELVGESTGKVIETYNFEGEDNDGNQISVQISKKGGKLVEFNYFKDCSGKLIGLEETQNIADEFIKKVGYDNMKAVWMADSGNIVAINYASVVNGVICYSDLIKVNVCRERGIVSGLEATSYIYNHTDRKVEKAALSLKEAKAKVEGEIEVSSSRLAIIPKGETKEVLAYEFQGTKNNETYYIYIDVVTGKEVEIFKVIDSTEGLLLM